MFAMFEESDPEVQGFPLSYFDVKLCNRLAILYVIDVVFLIYSNDVLYMMEKRLRV